MEQTDVEICKTTAEKQRQSCNTSFIAQMLTSDVVLIALVLAVPYGILAETYGRKPIMLISIIGIAAEVLIDVLICRWSVFPLELVSLYSAYEQVGFRKSSDFGLSG
jgi:MFS family permease